MKRLWFAAAGLLCLIHVHAFARGVSPYLPLNLDPEIERQIERLLILADKPVLTRPIAAATVLDALADGCPKDPELCQRVRRYLARYMKGWGLTELSVEAATSSGPAETIANRYGLETDSAWDVSARGFWQPNDHALVSLGGTAYEHETLPDGTMLSVGFAQAQLDLGYRAHWLSPLTDSSMLIGTEAATMPSITLSSYAPLTRFGLQYEMFVASMSSSNSIEFGGALQSGRPRLAGVHLSMEPARGWALGLNRLLQYGGGGRPGSASDLFKAFFNPSGYDNASASLGLDQQFGNQVASITSQFLFPGKTPFTVYFEYAGEDTSAGSNYLLGNSSLSGGIHFPRIGKSFELTYEVSEWQNAWYVNGVYGDGLTNKGHVLGHWGGDQRRFGDAVGAQSHMLRLDWTPQFGGLVDLRLRTLENQTYTGFDYRRSHDITLQYSRVVGTFTLGAEGEQGRDVFGESFSRFGVFARYSPEPDEIGSSLDLETSDSVDSSAELFVSAGASANKVRIDLTELVPATRTGYGIAPHFAVGARRAVSDRSDLGTRLELDDVNGHTLIGVRAIDYRYRFANPLALGVFVGAARYALATPAYGVYYGAGLEWRNVQPGWDVGMEFRYGRKVARDRLLPSDPKTAREDSFYDIYSTMLSITRRF